MTTPNNDPVPPRPACACGAALPWHLLSAVTTHTCSCERHYVVDNPRTVLAEFRLLGTRPNPFARYDKDQAPAEKNMKPAIPFFVERTTTAGPRCGAIVPGRVGADTTCGQPASIRAHGAGYCVLHAPWPREGKIDHARTALVQSAYNTEAEAAGIVEFLIRAGERLQARGPQLSRRAVRDLLEQDLRLAMDILFDDKPKKAVAKPGGRRKTRP